MRGLVFDWTCWLSSQDEWALCSAWSRCKAKLSASDQVASTYLVNWRWNFWACALPLKPSWTSIAPAMSCRSLVACYRHRLVQACACTRRSPFASAYRASVDDDHVEVLTSPSHGVWDFSLKIHLVPRATFIWHGALWRSFRAWRGWCLKLGEWNFGRKVLSLTELKVWVEAGFELKAYGGF